MLISFIHTKLTQLLEKLEALVKKVEDMRYHNSVKEIMKVTIVEKELLQRKVDTQIFSINSFRYISQIGDEEHMRLHKKHESMEEAWHSALLKLDGWKRHKLTLYVQVQAMLSGNQRPTFAPSPLPFLGLEVNMKLLIHA
jgi:hypothetical protein